MTSLIRRLIWIMIGPAAMAMILMAQMQDHFDPARLKLSIAYFSIAGAVLLARYLDQRSGEGLTAMAEPSTWKDFRTYTFKFITFSSLGWMGAFFISKWI